MSLISKDPARETQHSAFVSESNQQKNKPAVSLVFETFADQEPRRREQAVDLITTRPMCSEVELYKISGDQRGENKGNRRNPARQAGISRSTVINTEAQSLTEWVRRRLNHSATSSPLSRWGCFPILTAVRLSRSGRPVSHRLIASSPHRRSGAAGNPPGCSVLFEEFDS
jgi:hypothetical protein